MTTTKTVSFRIPYNLHQEIILECESKNITITEYFERKIAKAGTIDKLKREIKINVLFAQMYLYIDDNSATKELDKILAIVEKK